MTRYFPEVSGLVVSSAMATGFTVAWNAPVPVSAYPWPLAQYDVAVSAGTALGAVAARYTVPAGTTTVQVTGLHSGTLYTVGVRAQALGGQCGGGWVTAGAMTAGISQSQVTSMMNFMVSQKGKPYTQVNPTRFGPTAYDCSGLVYAATRYAGVPLPQSQATAHIECGWFYSQPGAQVIPGIPELKAGDIVGCLGSDPDDVTINGHTYHVGHIGLMVDGTNLVSALNAKEGVALANINYMQAQIAIRVQS